MMKKDFTLEKAMLRYKDLLEKGWAHYFLAGKGSELPPEERQEELEYRLSKMHEEEIIELNFQSCFVDNRYVLEKITVPLAYFYADPGNLFDPRLHYYYGEHVSGAYKAVAFPSREHSFYILEENNAKKMEAELLAFLNEY